MHVLDGDDVGFKMVPMDTRPVDFLAKMSAGEAGSMFGNPTL
jgi:hypothetical protein